MKKAQGLSLNLVIIVAIALIVLVVLIAIFTGRLGYVKSKIDYDRICNKLDFYPPFEEKEDRIEQELKGVFNHNLWVDCTTKERNQFYGKEGDIIECKMNCYAYHYTEYYYTPLYYWYEFNYTDYQNWKEERP